jgi:hypothetical protein
MDTDLLPQDEVALSFIAAHDLVIFSQVRQVLEEDRAGCTDRLKRLVANGWIEPAPRLRFQNAAYRITRAGLDRLGGDLPEPLLDMRGYWQGLALGWLWVHARKGNFGSVGSIFSRRAMRAADRSAGASIDPAQVSPALQAKLADTRFALDLGGGRVHYPGLVLVLPDHGRLAMEYLMSAPSRSWRWSTFRFLKLAPFSVPVDN